MNLKSDVKKSTERPDSGPFSALHTGHFLEFESVFWTPESDEPNLLCVGNQSNEKYITADIKEELIQGMTGSAIEITKPKLESLKFQMIFC